jgi:nitrate reductase (NAD(P)H)
VAPKRQAVAAWTAPQAAVAESKKADVPGEKVKDIHADKIDTWMKEGIPMSEVERNNTDKSAWIVVKDRVYDCTPYLEDHPGGASSIMLLAGGEATEDFEAVHSKKAWKMLEDHYFIGRLQTGNAASAKKEEHKSVIDITKPFLDPRKAQKLPLVEKIEVSHDTRIFRFGLPHPEMRLGLPTGCHMFLRAKINDEVVMRAYSPMTDDETLGHVDLMVKVYFKGVHPKFPDGGKMSQHLESMKIGDTIDVKGPLGEFIYTGPGAYTWMHEPRQCKFINMIAGGTGLTPCHQVAQAVLRNSEDHVQVRLLYANQSPSDILMRDTLDRLAEKHPDRFRVWYTVDNVKDEKDWKYSTGFIDEPMIKDHLFPANDDTITVMCGPPPMVKFACIPNLQKQGHTDRSLMVF